MSEPQNPFAGAEIRPQITAYPLVNWRLALIESLPRAVDFDIGWTVRLERTSDNPHRRRSVQAMSTNGLIDAWDQAIRMAQEYDREREA